MIRIGRLIKSFKYAIHGLIKTFKEEQNFKIHSSIALLVIVLGFYFKITRIEWMMIIFIIVLVMLMELANSAVERIADVLKPRLDTYVKEIKDISAAMVLLSSLLAIGLGILVFWPYVFL